MIEKLIEVIKHEDPKNPLKDNEISNILGIDRVRVNELRQKAGIPNYLERREALLKENIYELVSKDPMASIRKICMGLNRQGFKISIFGLQRYKGYITEIKEKVSQDLIESENEVIPEKLKAVEKRSNERFSPFSSFIGAEGSMKRVIQMAEAAVLYPPSGLHTLIIGNSGVGKSRLVEEMYLFAKTVKKRPQMPLVVFNCADYSDNPQLLVSQLFGHRKGSFTGAVEDKHGLVEKADGGILFLDEIHSLPSKGQEILFRIIDKGEFSRLGETDKTRQER